MKLPRLLIFSGLVLGQGLTAALAQTDNDSRRVPATVVASPFQALGNVIRNPDADPPRRARHAAIAHAAIAAHHHSAGHVGEWRIGQSGRALS
jgi:hypothetical protein